MKTVLKFAAAAMVAATIMPSLSAQAEDWRVSPLSDDGWSLQEQGDADDPASYTIKVVFDGPDFDFSYACVRGIALQIEWLPEQVLEGGILVPVTFSVDGETLLEHTVANNDRMDYSWLDRVTAEPTDADTVVFGIWEAWTGTLTISGGGLTSAVPFNEEQNGGYSEEVLFTCGLL